MDYYNILGVEKDATLDELKDAYRKRAAECHPDRENGDGTDFALVASAYEILSDPEKRGRHDRGEDVRPGKSITELLAPLIAGAFTQFQVDPVVFMKNHLNNEITNITKKKMDAKSHRTKMRSRFKRFKKANPSDTLVGTIIDSHIVSIERQLQQADMALKELQLMKTTIEVLNEFEMHSPQSTPFGQITWTTH